MIRLHKGTRKAMVRMAELRDRKRFLHKQALISRWSLLSGRKRNEWWHASGLEYGCGQEASISWLAIAIADLERSKVSEAA